MPDIQITPACAPHQQTHAPRSSRTDALSLSLSPNRHESRHGSRRAAETLVRQSGVGSVHRRMSSSYKALLQSLDDDVVRGLGRQIKLKNERYANRRKTCCSRCCASAFTRWLCVLLCLAVGLAASVAIPMVIVLPVDSQWHYRHWFHNWRYFASNGSNFTEDFRGNGTRFETEAEGTVSGGNGTRAATFFEETARQWRQMTEWLKHRYEETPKVPLLVGLAIPLAGFIAIASVVIYRKMKRRQRRRALGKLVTDLQSGKTLLASDSDSDED